MLVVGVVSAVDVVVDDVDVVSLLSSQAKNSDNKIAIVYDWRPATRDLYLVFQVDELAFIDAGRSQTEASIVAFVAGVASSTSTGVEPHVLIDSNGDEIILFTEPLTVFPNKTFEDDVILYGESLGTAVAVEVAQNKNFAGVILESPFTSMIDAAKNKYPFLPIKFLLKDKYESVSKIKNIKTPILIMHGKKDDLVPFAMGKKMYETANEPKYSYFSDYDNHMMNYDENLLKVLNEYIYSLN